MFISLRRCRTNDLATQPQGQGHSLRSLLPIIIELHKHAPLSDMMCRNADSLPRSQLKVM